MSALTRRLFLLSSAAAAASIGAGSAVAQEMTAAMPGEGMATMSLRDALMRRESIRLFNEEPVDEETLLALLWAANGVNRPDVDGRTAPSWRTAKDTDIYVARADGVSLFDPVTNTLTPVLDADIRKQASTQPFVGTAPVVLIYVSDYARVLAAAGVTEPDPAAITEAHRIAANVDAAVIAQNVYLFCAAEGLGTCLVGGADREALTAALELTETRAVVYVQPVGHPKD